MERKDTFLQIVTKIHYCCIFCVHDLDAFL